MANIKKIKIGSTEYDIKDAISGYITGINSTDVTNALGYTPYNSSNPNGYTSNVGTVTSVNNTSPDGSGNVSLTIPTVNNATLTIQKNGTSVATFTANSSTNATANITVPTDTGDLTNGAGFITGITSGDVTTALGYTPYDASNPSGYTSNVGTVTSVNNTSPDGNGNVTLSIPTVNDSTITIQKNGTTVDSFTTNASSGKSINITVPTSAADVSALPSSTKYGADLSYSSNTLQLKDQDGNNLGSAVTISGGGSLPSQTGNSGKFLTTDGTDASWASVDALPSQTGNSGKILTTDGTDASWAVADYVVESYNNGTDWYRVYKSGFIEQGGVTSKSSNHQVVTFLKPFSDTNYNVIVGNMNTTANTGGVSVTSLACDLTTTTFQVSQTNQSTRYTTWRACGF